MIITAFDDDIQSCDKNHHNIQTLQIKDLLNRISYCHKHDESLNDVIIIQLLYAIMDAN